MIEKLSMGNGKPLPPTLPDQDIYTVEFEEKNDPLHPYNWSRSTKYGSSRLQFPDRRNTHNLLS